MSLMSKGMTQTDIAKHLGVKPSSVNHLLKGRQMLEDEKIEVLAKMLNEQATDIMIEKAVFQLEQKSRLTERDLREYFTRK